MLRNVGHVSIRETLIVLVVLLLAGLATVVVLSADGAPPTRWRADLGSAATAGPAMRDGRIFAGSEAGNVVALNALTGGTMWDQPTDATPRGAILADGERIYLRTDEGHLLALDAASGTERWSLRPEGGVNAPLLADDLLIFAGRGGAIVALEASTGDERWRAESGRTIRAGPALAGASGEIVAVGDIGGRLITVDRETGALLDEVTVGGEFAGPILQVGELLLAGPRTSVVALDSDGVERWRTEIGQPTRLPMIARDGVVYVDASPDIVALDQETGEVRWRYTSRALAVTFGVGEGLVIAGMHQGEVHGVDLLTGERSWRYRTNESVRGSPVVDEQEGVAYFAGLDGSVYAIALREDEEQGCRWWPW